jgi:L-fuconolactonase
LIVDSHHHFWDPSRREYPWMGDELASIRRAFGPEDLRPLLSADRVDRTIVVQTISSVEESREFLATAATTDFIAGVIGWVDLTDPQVDTALAELRSGPGGNHLVGIRHQVHDEADERWLLRDDVLRGLRAVGEANLVYDLLVRTRELPSAHEVARQFPGIRFVIDHIGKPHISAGARDPEWEQAMAPFAALPNVSCKLSGMVTEASWSDWTLEDLAPYVHRVLDWFGPERCMFGSDWPVCLLAATYGEVIEALKLSLRELDAAETAGVLGGNATRVYGLTN